MQHRVPVVGVDEQVQVAGVHVVHDVLAVGVHHLHVILHLLLRSERGGVRQARVALGRPRPSPFSRLFKSKVKVTVPDPRACCGALGSLRESGSHSPAPRCLNIREQRKAHKPGRAKGAFLGSRLEGSNPKLVLSDLEPIGAQNKPPHGAPQWNVAHFELKATETLPAQETLLNYLEEFNYP